MKWKRIAGAFPWRNALLLVVLFASQFLCWRAWITFEIPPLQRHYLPAYYMCTQGMKNPGSRCQFEPLFETASGRKSRFVLPADIVSGKTGDLPLQLSGTALDHGWIGLTKGPLILDDSSAVESFLRGAFYQGRPFWQWAQEPLWSGAIMLLLVLAVASVSFGRALISEWSYLWTVTVGLIWSNGPGWDSTTDRGVINSLIRQVSIRFKARRQSAREFLSSALRKDRGRVVSERTPKTPEKVWGDRPVPPHSTGTVPASQSQWKALPIDRSNVPAKPRYIFPGKDGITVVNYAPGSWDESQWIE